MDEALRRSAGHVLVADVDAPVADAPTDPPPRRVLRLRDGAVVTVTDGAGRGAPVAGRMACEPDGDVIAERADRPTVIVAVAPAEG